MPEIIHKLSPNFLASPASDLTRSSPSEDLVRPLWDRFPVSAKEVDPFGIQYEIMRPDDTRIFIDELARRVKDKFPDTEAIVYPLRGGVVPGKAVASALNCEAYPLGLKLYHGIQAFGEAADQEVLIYQPLVDGGVEGKKVGLIDDVNDTSKTLTRARQYLMDQGAKSVYIAVMHEKPANRTMTADIAVRRTNSWIVYEWEHRGGLLHPQYEFFLDALPPRMVTDWVLYPFTNFTSWARDIGFTDDEIPKLNDPTFLGHLATALNNRYQQLFGCRIPKEDWPSLLPGVSVS